MASRVQTAVTMRAVTGSMMNVVKGMDQAMKAMDLEKVRSSASPYTAGFFKEVIYCKSWELTANRSLQSWTASRPSSKI